MIVGLQTLQGRLGLVFQSRLSPSLRKPLQNGCREAEAGSWNLPVLRSAAARPCLNTLLLFLPLRRSGHDLEVSGWESPAPASSWPRAPTLLVPACGTGCPRSGGAAPATCGTLRPARARLHRGPLHLRSRHGGPCTYFVT